MVVIVAFLKNPDDRTFFLKFKLAQVCATSYCVVICVQAENRMFFNSLSYDCIDIRYNLNGPNRCILGDKALTT